MKAREADLEAKHVEDLLYQALETELGGVEIYRMAILCARNADLKKEWTEYHRQTQRHVEILREVFQALKLDPEAATPGRTIVRDKGKALLAAMGKARQDAPDAAELVAAECVVDAETKDHRNWELIGGIAGRASGATKKVLSAAYAEVEHEEDEHLYHTMGWCRELAFQALGLPAVLPPPEEKEDVQSAVEEAQTAGRRKSAVRRGGNGSPRARA